MIVLDTNVVVSAADTDEPRHGACTELLRRHRAELVLPTTVVVESSWFIEDRLGPGAEAKYLRSVTSGELRRQDLTDTDWERATGLVEGLCRLGPRVGRRQRRRHRRAPRGDHHRHLEPPRLHGRAAPSHRGVRAAALRAASSS